MITPTVRVARSSDLDMDTNGAMVAWILTKRASDWEFLRLCVGVACHVGCGTCRTCTRPGPVLLT